jgi:hypothetical protein
MAELAARFGMNRSPNDRVVFVDLCRRGPFLALLLAGVLVQPVPVRVKSETPSSRARRGVAVALAMFDFGESRCDVLEADFEKCEERLPPYVDVDARMLSFLDDGLSGVKGDELLTAKVIVRARGDGVRGILPPAVLDENMPACDLMGVHTAVAIVQSCDLGRKTT